MVRAAVRNVHTTYRSMFHDSAMVDLAPSSPWILSWGSIIGARGSSSWFGRSGHLPNTEEREKFNRLLVDAVLPALRG